MNQLRQKPILFIFILISLTALACQAATLLPQNNEESRELNDNIADEIIADAVATVSAQATVVNVSNSSGQAVEVVTADLENRFIDIYNQVNPAVVHIFVFENDDLLATGSGFVIDNEGNIVTNNHVVEGGAEYEVVFASGDRRRAELRGNDLDSDLAVIQVNSLPPDVIPVQLGDSSNLQVGQFVIAIGNPFGEAGSMSIGIISGLGRTLESQNFVAGGTFSIPQVIQTDAAINPGNSGGPLLNLSGEVIGVNSNILSTTGVNAGVGFSIPVNAVRNISPALIADGTYVYPYLGISMWSQAFTLRQLDALGLPPNGVFILSVGRNTPAEAAGLNGHDLYESFRADGDYITAINGQPVKNPDDLLSYLVFETAVGETVELTLIRDGEEVVLSLTLGERP
ncbi:Outer membrane stress sensor protease DegQ, serine protease [hydrothermal vent metagenome]|uniref:Outer membrane stress sensor protease DegQ, serine protease n=1 Tax=hydrothermal vent metagenome TaxID=652676 RepID=A0A3B0VTY9_9ZZZZ